MPYFKQLPRGDYRISSDEFAFSRRNLGSTLGSTTLTYKGVIGIAIGGAIFVFAIACLVLVRHARIRDRRERKKMQEEVQKAEEQMDLKTAVSSIKPPDVVVAQRLSADAYDPRRAQKVYTEREGANKSPYPDPMAEMIPIEYRTYSRSSRIRESWPLTNIPLSILPAQSTMTLNQVAPPGYIVSPESKWPRRHGSRHSRSKVTIPSPQSSSQSLVLEPAAPAPRTRRPVPQRRPTSETQLSTILRSTSQRLKSAQSHSLKRTLTSFGRLPGSPPKHRLPTPPVGRKKNESSEELIEANFFESPNSSVIEAYMRTPSPEKPERNEPSTPNSNFRKSAASSAISDDSLCEMELSEMVVPGLLTSPNRQNNPPTPRYRMTISTSTLIQPKLDDLHRRASVLATGKHQFVQEPRRKNLSQQRISSCGDPFYSHVKSGKPVFPKNNIQGPRPLYVRKATFGQNSTAERPASYALPLQDVSGNAQLPQRKSAPLTMSSDTNDRNPFQWSPQASMQERPRQRVSPRHGSKPKGHKRSNVVRISNLPRPSSVISVRPVLEEPEENPAELRFNIPPTAPLRLSGSIKSPSPSPMASPRRHSARPPSLATFNPTLTIPDLKSPSTFNQDNQYTPITDSPTLSVGNYYTELSGNSEEDFFNSKRPAIPPRNLKRNRSANPEQHRDSPTRTEYHAQNQSGSPDLPSPEPEPVKLISFPPPSLSSSPHISLTNPASGIVFSPASLQPSPTTLAPLQLTMPIPAHLTGSRHQPKSGSSSPAPDSLHMSVCMLRRMNSEISLCTNGSDDRRSPFCSLDSSLQMPHPSNIIRSPSADEDRRGRSRGSRNYLSMGSLGSVAADSRRSRATISHSASVRNSRVLGTRDRRNSTTIYKERRRRIVEEEFSDADLKSVRELSIPEIQSSATTEFKFPMPSRNGSVLQSSPRTPASGESPVLPPRKYERWSDAMPKPVQSSVRRESMIESPSPKSLKMFAFENRSLGTDLGNRKKTRTGDKKVQFMSPSPQRPESLGLYDADGFLKSSPFRPKEAGL